MTPDRAEELKRTLKLGSEIEAMKARCRVCDRTVDAGELADGRCEKCHDKANGEGLSQSTLRRRAFERDHGVCQLCRENTLKIREDLDALKKSAEEGDARNDPRPRALYKARIYFFTKIGFDEHALTSGASLWEAHHKNEKALGGSDSLSNVVSLCLRCHAGKTGAFARARRRRRGR